MILKTQPGRTQLLGYLALVLFFGSCSLFGGFVQAQELTNPKWHLVGGLSYGGTNKVKFENAYSSNFLVSIFVGGKHDISPIFSFESGIQVSKMKRHTETQYQNALEPVFWTLTQSYNFIEFPFRFSYHLNLKKCNFQPFISLGADWRMLYSVKYSGAIGAWNFSNTLTWRDEFGWNLSPSVRAGTTFGFKTGNTIRLAASFHRYLFTGPYQFDDNSILTMPSECRVHIFWIFRPFHNGKYRDIK